MVAPLRPETSVRPPFVRRPAFAALGLVGVTLLVYAGSFPGIFTFDDVGSVLENTSIRPPFRLRDVLWPPAEAGVGGRPLANLTFAFNHALSGTAPWSYHLFNLVVHVGTALALFGVLRRTFLQPSLQPRFGGAALPLAAAIALLWAVHPLASVVVNYVSQRTESLMAGLYLLTLYGFIRGAPDASARWLGVSVAAAALGMAAKETMATAPLAVLLYDRTFVAGSWRAALRTRRGYYAALAATWLPLGALVAASQLAERGVGFDLGVSWRDYALTQARAILIYLKLAVWPTPLVFDYGWTFDRSPVLAAGRVLGCAGLLAAAWLAWRRWPPAGFAGGALFLVLAPTSTVVPIIQQPIAENRAYLPLALLGAILAATVYRAVGRRAAWPLLAALAALGASTGQRHAVFGSEVALWSDTAAKAPRNARAFANLSAALLRAGRPAEAVPAAETALRALPAYPDARHNLALALARSGRTTEALEQYQEALRRNPASADTRYNLGEALAQAGRWADAQREFATALRLNPRHARALNNLSVASLQLGQAAAAAGHARAALQLEPGFAEAHYNLGNALAQLGQRASAIAAYAAAIQAQPAFAQAHNNLGALLLQAGDRASAIGHFEAALRIDPTYASARRNLELAQAAPR